MKNSKQLIAFLVDDLDEKNMLAFKAFVKSLDDVHWNHGSPYFIHEIDEESCTQKDDIPLVTLGCGIFIPENPESSIGIEVASLNDVIQLIDHLKRYSREMMAEIELELDGDYIGTIEDGDSTSGVFEGLISPWKKLIQDLKQIFKVKILYS